MVKTAEEHKTIELWDGYEVEVKTQLLDDFDFQLDLKEAQKNKDMGMLVEMYMALVGGRETYEKIREHITEKHGYFSESAFTEIIEKINAVLPKGGNRAQRRSWKNSN